nr:cupredoxin family copper-binding protein [Hartmannibacter diazotrophicus]
MALALGIAAGAQATAAETASVSIENFTFSPAELTVTAGTTVTFTNHDDIPHTVVATDNSFKSKPLDTDDTYTITFKDQGSFDYFCSLHPHMTGKVIVLPNAG